MADEGSSKDEDQNVDQQVQVNKKIETAVKFLQNPKVQQTPLIQRKAFLAKKGLNKDEIIAALKQAGVPEQDIEGGPSTPRLQFQNGPIEPVRHVQYSISLRDYFMVALIGGGLGYTVEHFVKTFILPYFFESKDDKDEKIEDLHSSIREMKETLNETVCGIQGTLDSVQKLLESQQQKVQDLSLSLTTTQSGLTTPLTDSYSLSDVKSELSSLKGLLLNRQQFPSPVVQSSPFSGIPSWQRNNVRQQETETKLKDVTNGVTEDRQENGVSSNADSSDSTSTLEVVNGEVAEPGESQAIDQSDTSFSTMSSEVGSPNLSLSELKENLSNTYVRVTNDGI